MFFDDLLRSHGQRPLSVGPELRKRRSPLARRASVTHDGEMAEPRKPLISWSDVKVAFQRELKRRGIDLEATGQWPAVLVQTRISRTHEGRSSSPERQMNEIMEWLVDNQLRPLALSREEMSGSRFRKRRRQEFEELFADIEGDAIVDPTTGERIKAIVCWRYDRFTRDPKEGEPWLDLLLRKRIDLYEAKRGKKPDPLPYAVNDIRERWIQAEREVLAMRERGVSEQRRRAELGYPNFHTTRLFGHEPVYDKFGEEPGRKGKICGYKANRKAKVVVDQIADRIIGGESLYSVMLWLNENGYRNADGRLWTIKTLGQFLRAPRLCGLIRVRHEIDKVFAEDSYAGELFPVEMIYTEEEGPDPEYVPKIEPLISYPKWKRLQDVLDSRVRRRGPRPQHFATGILGCTVCENRMKADSRDAYHCPKRKLEGQRNTTGRRDLAADGRRHPSVVRKPVDMFLEEVLFAVVDNDHEPADSAFPEEIAARLAEIEGALAELGVQLDDLKHSHLDLRLLPRAEFDARVAEVRALEAALLRERDGLTGVERIAKLPEGRTLRDLWPELSVERRREWLAQVIDHVDVFPRAAGRTSLAERLSFTFRGGYQPPAEEFKKLLEEIDAQVTGATIKRQLSAASEKRNNLLFDMFSRGVTTIEMKRILVNHPDPQIREFNWSNMSHLLKKLCAERGVPYQVNYEDRWKVSLEDRELMLDLYLQLRCWAAVGHELNRLGIKRSGGGEWSASHVRDTVLRHAHQKGVAVPRPEKSARRGRPHSLPDAMRHQLWRMHYRDGMSYRKIADWLTKRGIKTARGGAWHMQSVVYIIKAVDRERQQMEAKAAA